MISQSLLKEYFIYNPGTGIFTIKKVLKFSTRKIGEDVSIWKDKDGYLSFSFKIKNYKVHRLAFLYMTGSIPKTIDHIDRNPSNNKWSNLREATISQNCMNLNKHKDNTSGYKGVFFYKDPKMKKPWYARIQVKGKRLFLGCFKTKKQAAKAYDTAAKLYHKEFANINLKNKYDY